MSVRSSGILLHPSSLPSEFGIGDLGPSAFQFAEFLMETGQRRWQMLPLCPTEAQHGQSPYHSRSAFAGNTLLISPEVLVRQGFLKAGETKPYPDADSASIDFGRAAALKLGLLTKACERFETRVSSAAYQRFCRRSPWLDDFALYQVLREGPLARPWYRWPPPLRDRDPKALRQARRRFARPIAFQKKLQYLFFQQWFALKRFCNRRQIHLIGDMPIYVPLDSVDVWVHPQYFKLDSEGRPLWVSGVPPDYFSATGQLWGHPVYDWQRLQAAHYDWWFERVRHAIAIFDLIRIDHFRGLVAFWEVPAGDETAEHGRWVPAPARDFLTRLIKRFGPLPVIAEDLGTITADVRELTRRFELPGMRVLQFAFGDDFPDSPFLPHRHPVNCVAYTGTHDNNTLQGWFAEEADPLMRRNLFRYIGREVAAGQLHWEMIRLALMSPAATAIVPLQDVMGLDARARMNRPASREGNWRWRLQWHRLDPETADRLREMTATYGRL
ncbi:MAG: 4-alpha-glucanotransferase [Desulfosarcinaceae bacterium]